MALDPLESYEEVMRFAASRGESALCLAMHAAVLQVLRLDLLHLLRLNFVPEAIDDPALEADVLFAPFCESLGNGYYRFDAHARRHLVKQLDPHYRAEQGQRSRRVATFLLSYFDEQLRVNAETNDLVYAGYVEVERWVALAFYDADAAARQLASALRSAAESAPAAARFRFAGLAGAVATPLAGQRSLVAYTAGIEALERGDLAAARDILEPLGDAEMVVAGVSLPSPAGMLRKSLPAATEVKKKTHESEKRVEASLSEAAPPPSPSADAIAKIPAEPDSIYISGSNTIWRDMLRRSLAEQFGPTIGQLLFVGNYPDGDGRRQTSSEAIDRARVAVVFVSEDYLASPFHQHELQALIERARSGHLKLTWVLVEPCDWKRTPLAQYAAEHDVSGPFSRLPEQEIRRILKELARWIHRLFDHTATGRLRVFVAWTHQDLSEHRHAVSAALQQMIAVQSVDMESFGASVETSMERVGLEVVDCDVLILIIGWRYGYIPPSEKLSITEMTFHGAKELGRPILAFLASEELSPSHESEKMTEDVEDRARVLAFRKLVTQQQVVSLFTSPDDLAVKVMAEILRLADSRRRGFAKDHITQKLGPE